MRDIEGGLLTCLRRREEKSPEGIFLTKAGAGQTHSGVNVGKGERKMASEEMNGLHPRSCVSVLICCTSCAPQRRAGLGQCKSDESYAARLKTRRVFRSLRNCPGRIKNSTGTPWMASILPLHQCFLRFLVRRL